MATKKTSKKVFGISKAKSVMFDCANQFCPQGQYKAQFRLICISKTYWISSRSVKPSANKLILAHSTPFS